jgi:outer membrane biosynthesis protein TonB
MKRLILTGIAVLALAFASITTAAANTPPGNDGDPCHGANQETCRPDPQPSDGQDCLPHGNNPDGNDDHCASPEPTVTPEPSASPSPEPTSTPTPSESSSPSVEPSVTPSSAPSEKPSTPSVPTSKPLPPTDTDAVATTTSSPFFPLLIAAFVVFFVTVLSLNPKRR